MPQQTDTHTRPAAAALAPAVVGLCPLLAISTSLIQGLALGLATTAVLGFAALVASLVRRALRPELRIVVLMLIVAALVSALDQALQAYLDPLRRALGIFVPLIASNCIILSRLETFATRNSPLPATLNALAAGLRFTGVFIVLGAVRELIATGSLLGDAQRLLHVDLQLPIVHGGLPLAALPPGAFLALALLLALRNLRVERSADLAAPAPTGDGVQ